MTKKVLVLLISLLVSLGICEIGFRLLGLADPILYEADPEIGYLPKPNQSTTRLGKTVKINNLGLREEGEVKVDSLSEREVVLFVGNSVTYGGSRNSQGELFTERLERLLGSDSARVRVLNAGVNGYSVTQAVGRAMNLVPVLSPHTVVVYLVPDDFYRPPVRHLKGDNWVFPFEKPKSALLEFVRRSGGYLDRRFSLPGWLVGPMRGLWSEGPYVESGRSKEEYVPVHTEGLRELLNFNAANGVLKTVVFLAPTRRELCGESNATESLAETVGGAVGDSVVTDLTREFGEQIRCERIGEYYWDRVHYRSPGHRVAARVLFDKLPAY